MDRVGQAGRGGDGSDEETCMEACAAAYRLRLGMRGGTCGGDGGDDQIPCVKKALYWVGQHFYLAGQ
jgi:hypothetical protein